MLLYDFWKSKNLVGVDQFLWKLVLSDYLVRVWGESAQRYVEKSFRTNRGIRISVIVTLLKEKSQNRFMQFSWNWFRFKQSSNMYF